MKFGVVFLSGLIFFSYLCFGQSYSHITNLRGIEDSSGHTQLFYRYLNPSPSCWSKSIFHLDVYNHIDTLFIYDAASDPIGEGCRGDFVYDYEFFHNNISEFIYGGYDFYFDPVPILRRYDGDVQLPFAGFGGVTEIEISTANNNLVYAVIERSALYRSTDGGYNFEINLDSLPLIDNAIISLSKNNDSQIFGIDDNKLVRSEDEGYSYTIVDNSFWDDNSDLFYDADGSHIYGLSNYYVFSTQSYISNIFVSNDNGNPFTWDSIVSDEIPLKFSFDENQTGEIYYSKGKQIFKSTDYGTTFNLYRTLERNVTGLYKKSGTNILYASTPLKIYEITPTDIQVIKELTIPQEVFDFFPIEFGNLWVYSVYTNDGNGQTYHGDESKGIIDTTTLSTGFKYYLYKHTFINGDCDTIFLRSDLLSGKLFAYSFNTGTDLLFDDLLADGGDTVCYEYNPAWNCQYVQNERSFSIFGLNTFIKEYLPQAPGWYFGHSLVKGIGLYEIYNGDIVTYNSTLKGCIIDGIVYGDTTVVSVEKETSELPKNFSLSQNFPNPFNPTTKIKFAISELRFTTLKIYDILGEEVATLVNEEKPAGEYEVEFNIGTSRDLSLSSGIYFYQLKAGSFVQTKKMILLK